MFFTQPKLFLDPTFLSGFPISTLLARLRHSLQTRCLRFSLTLRQKVLMGISATLSPKRENFSLFCFSLSGVQTSTQDTPCFSFYFSSPSSPSLHECEGFAFAFVSAPARHNKNCYCLSVPNLFGGALN